MDQEQEFPAVVDLNVGGRHFSTHLSTLTKEPDSMLAAMFSGRHPCSKDKDGRFFIDADGKIFYHILNYLRFNRLPSGDVLLVYEQARYFGLQSLISKLELFSAVQLEIWLEKIRATYPWYRDVIKSLVEQPKNMKPSQAKAPVTIEFRCHTRASSEQMCCTCPLIVWKTVAEDCQGDALDFLIRQELEQKKFDMSKVTSTSERCESYIIPSYTGPPYYGQSYEQSYNQCSVQKRTIKIEF